MKNILIAGSTGFVGKHLNTNLLGQGSYNVKTLDRSSGDYSFSDLDSIEESFDTVFILFSKLPSKEYSLEDYMEVNYELTKKLVDKFKNARLVFSSSISVYENCLLKPVKESDLGLGISDYAKSKFAAERLFENLNSIILRLSSLYGPGMKEATFLPIVLNSALEKKEITLIGDSCRKQNYTYIEDVVDFLITAATSDETGVFNAVNTVSSTNEELALAIQELLPETKIKNLEDKKRFYSYEVSSEKWNNCFNCKSKISLKEGLSRLLKYKKDV